MSWNWGLAFDIERLCIQDLVFGRVYVDPQLVCVAFFGILQPSVSSKTACAFGVSHCLEQIRFVWVSFHMSHSLNF